MTNYREVAKQVLEDLYCYDMDGKANYVRKGREELDLETIEQVIAKAVEDEREKCAEVADNYTLSYSEELNGCGVAKAIRERGDK